MSLSNDTQRPSIFMLTMITNPSCEALVKANVEKNIIEMAVNIDGHKTVFDAYVSGMETEFDPRGNMETEFVMRICSRVLVA